VVGFKEAEIIRPEEKEVTRVEERCADTSGVSSASVEGATLRADSAAAQENRTPNFKTNTLIVRHRNIGVSFES
jgi:hypothetical protein